jgi:hypothetical protein
VLPTIVLGYGCWHAGNLRCFAPYLQVLASTHKGQLRGLYPLVIMVTTTLRDGRPSTVWGWRNGKFRTEYENVRELGGRSAGPCDETNPFSRQRRTDAKRGGQEQYQHQSIQSQRSVVFRPLEGSASECNRVTTVRMYQEQDVTLASHALPAECASKTGVTGTLPRLRKRQLTQSQGVTRGGSKSCVRPISGIPDRALCD